MAYLKLNIKPKVLVVSHDAGGAEILSAYVKANQARCSFVCCLSGPAEKIFERKKIKKSVVAKGNNEAILKFLKNKNLVLTGTGWSSDFEIKAIQAAKKLGIKTATFLDHWVNYRERFGYPKKNWQSNLPNEIWVGDNDAYDLARKQFTGMKVRIVANPFFKEIKTAYKLAQKNSPQNSRGILFASEPFGAAKNAFAKRKKSTGIESIVLREFLEYLSKIKYSRTVIIRSHPAENRDKYAELIRQFDRYLRIEVSSNKSMYDDLARVSCVVGLSSMFLAVALLCGKKVISFIPDKTNCCSLPMKGIIRVKNQLKFRFALEKCRV